MLPGSIDDGFTAEQKGAELLYGSSKWRTGGSPGLSGLLSTHAGEDNHSPSAVAVLTRSHQL